MNIILLLLVGLYALIGLGYVLTYLFLAASNHVKPSSDDFKQVLLAGALWPVLLVQSFRK